MTLEKLNSPHSIIAAFHFFSWTRTTNGKSRHWAGLWGPSLDGSLPTVTVWATDNRKLAYWAQCMFSFNIINGCVTEGSYMQCKPFHINLIHWSYRRIDKWNWIWSMSTSLSVHSQEYLQKTLLSVSSSSYWNHCHLCCCHPSNQNKLTYPTINSSTIIPSSNLKKILWTCLGQTSSTVPHACAHFSKIMSATRNLNQECIHNLATSQMFHLSTFMLL